MHYFTLIYFPIYLSNYYTWLIVSGCKVAIVNFNLDALKFLPISIKIAFAAESTNQNITIQKINLQKKVIRGWLVDGPSKNLVRPWA